MVCVAATNSAERLNIRCLPGQVMNKHSSLFPMEPVKEVVERGEIFMHFEISSSPSRAI